MHLVLRLINGRLNGHRGGCRAHTGRQREGRGVDFHGLAPAEDHLVALQIRVLQLDLHRGEEREKKRRVDVQQRNRQSKLKNNGLKSFSFSDIGNRVKNNAETHQCILRIGAQLERNEATVALAGLLLVAARPHDLHAVNVSIPAEHVQKVLLCVMEKVQNKEQGQIVKTEYRNCQVYQEVTAALTINAPVVVGARLPRYKLVVVGSPLSYDPFSMNPPERLVLIILPLSPLPRSLSPSLSRPYLPPSPLLLLCWLWFSCLLMISFKKSSI